MLEVGTFDVEVRHMDLSLSKAAGPSKSSDYVTRAAARSDWHSSAKSPSDIVLIERGAMAMHERLKLYA